MQEIVKAKRAAPRFMGAIMCFEFRGVETASVACAQPRGIFDGQHRARACAQLLTSEAFSIEDDAPESWEMREGGGGGGGALIPGAPPQEGVDHETSWVWVFQK